MKPEPYRNAIQEYRFLFRGIEGNGTLRAVFVNSVQPSAWIVREDEIVWVPSLYFGLPHTGFGSPPGAEEYTMPFRFLVRSWY